MHLMNPEILCQQQQFGSKRKCLVCVSYTPQLAQHNGYLYSDR